MSEYELVQDAAGIIRQLVTYQPEVGIILGTGLGALASTLDKPLTIPYSSVPGFPVSTVESHEGRLVTGVLSGRNVAIMQGRFHKYEGYSLKQVTFPVRVMKALGIKTLIVTNACGSVNPLFKSGELMLIDDYINLLGDNPLIGVNDERFGPRFPDMSEPYSQRLLALAEEVAMSMQLNVHRGVYAAVMGPSIETRAEYRLLRLIGADVVGMSTVPETIVARHMGMEVLGISIITDECNPDSLKPLYLEDVIDAARIAEPLMTSLIGKIVEIL